MKTTWGRMFYAFGIAVFTHSLQVSGWQGFLLAIIGSAMIGFGTAAWDVK